MACDPDGRKDEPRLVKTARVGALIAAPPSGRLAFLIVFTFSAVFAYAYLPFILTEVGRDWTTYARSAHDLAQGSDLYFDHGELINLYPPSMAILWSWGVTPQLWLLASVIALGGVALLARAWAALGIYVLTVMQLPVLYDLLTGNVTSLYVGAIGIRLASRRSIAGVPLGIMLGIAPKPALAPFVLVLLLTAPRRAVVPLGVAVAISVVSAIAVGPGAYAEYLRALLDSQRQLAGWVGGNLGLARVGMVAVIAGLVAASAAIVISIRLLPWEGAMVVGLAVGPLVQPTLGFYYAALAIPGVIILWRRAPWTAVFVATAGIATAMITPVLSGSLVAAAALSSEGIGLRRNRRTRASLVTQ